VLPKRAIDDSLIPENIPIDIVYEDDDVIVINKAQEMIVHPAVGHYSGTLVNALLYHTQSLSSGDAFRPGIVHRLDKGTSGLLVVAKNDPAHFALSQQFASKKIHREYLALIQGVPLKTKGTIDAPMMKDPKNIGRMKVDLYSENTKEAITHYEVVEILGNKKSTLNTRFCLIRCRLETGRTHQIRVHMKHIGHPIIGDCVYGYKVPGLSRQFLHAAFLEFIHPTTKELRQFEIPMPKDLEEFLNALKV
jgi:23S rRNA pseudouridine1911/1915/1917 synthase